MGKCIKEEEHDVGRCIKERSMTWESVLKNGT